MPSTYFSRLNIIFRPGFRRLIIGQELGFQNSLVVLGERKLLFGISGLSISAPFLTLAEGHSFLPPATVTAQTLNSQLVNQRRNISVVGTSSNIFPGRSVSGSSYQICGIHVNGLLSSYTKILTCNPLLKISMATIDSVAVSMYNLSPRQVSHSNYATCAGVFCSKRSFDNCRKASMCLKYEEPSNRYAIYGYLTFSSVRRNFKSNKRLGPASKDFHRPSYVCYSAGAAPDVSFDGSRDEHVTSSAVSSGQEMVDYRALKLLSGSCYLPHPDKEETGGDDAHFICVNEQAIGVADGVGGWAALGVDAGQYARELMSNSVTAIQEEPKGSINPARVLEKAHSITKAKGSSTACIIALTDQGVHAINLGDSGFLVIRDGSTVFRSPVQQHDFNFTYQLECGSNGDLPSSGEVFAIAVAPGDVIIAGTDGLFDNLYNNEVNAVVVQAKRAGIGPQVTAEKIAALARQRAQDKNRQTPFSSAAQDAGFRYYGGKLDDITVIVSYITSLTNV